MFQNEDLYTKKENIGANAIMNIFKTPKISKEFIKLPDISQNTRNHPSITNHIHSNK